jgi:lactate permease
VTGLPLLDLSAMVGRQLPVFSVIVPFWLVWAMAGRGAMAEVWPACLTAGLSFAAVQFAVSNYHGPWLVDIVASLVSMGCLVALLKVWRPRTTWRFADEGGAAPAGAARAIPTRAAFRAWSPWVILSLFVFLWGLPCSSSCGASPRPRRC